MRLDAWLKQPHPPAERLRLIERLAQALNAVHDRGETLASIAPERVEVGSDLKIDLARPSGAGPSPDTPRLSVSRAARRRRQPTSTP